MTLRQRDPRPARPHSDEALALARRQSARGDAPFMLRAASRPAMVGAVAPSSRRLARAIGAAADGADRTVELGAGTGAVTAALLERHAGRPLTAVEIDPHWADGLRRRFPQLDVRCAPADEVLARLAADAGEIVVLVSSLPFRSLPPRWRDRTSGAIERFLLADPRRRLVQYTYQPREPFALRSGSALIWLHRRTVWLNLPPAWIWELRVRPDTLLAAA